MKLLPLSLAILVSTVSASFGVGFGISGSQTVLDEEHKVPGENPLYFCEDPKDYLVEIYNVDLDPNPPKPYVLRCCFMVFSRSPTPASPPAALPIEDMTDIAQWPGALDKG